MEEEWKFVEGTDRYLVSNFGRVKSLCQSKERIMVLKENKKTHYLSVGLMIQNKHKFFLVHRLVLSTFHPVPQMDKLEVNHKDEDRHNNNISNLEWVTSKENCNYGSRNETIGKLMCKKVLCVETNTIYKSGADAASQLGINKSSISNCCTGYRNRKRAGGFHWRFVE